ncbi:hypothetical protein D3OALGA1CA_5290 [Olavius algarvensis associated proteobacterium Delta 3]|nr:hypothetical protein D3OALGB2SA_4992 [Olavius algarvensis associated proteobacterium Delta 3]CAB5164613.1 hypothetical protein D3OALGA1CA_5290 [Olavius algarvensis associated proteobacterium Delta 3]
MGIPEMLAELPMFEHFTEEEIEAFAHINHSLQKFSKGEIVLAKGEDFPSLYLMIEGTVLITRTANNIKIRLAKLGPGEIFGEMSFFSKKPRSSDVVANGDVTLIKMDSDFFDKVNHEVRDKIKNYFIELLIARLDSMNEQIMKISKLMHT